MPLGSKSIKSLSREYTYREDEMTDEYACGDVARMPNADIVVATCVAMAEWQAMKSNALPTGLGWQRQIGRAHV